MAFAVSSISRAVSKPIGSALILRIRRIPFEATMGEIAWPTISPRKAPIIVSAKALLLKGFHRKVLIGLIRNQKGQAALKRNIQGSSTESAV